MSESESEAEYEPDEPQALFPYDKYYHDAHDKAEIEAKPEIERESILAQRMEQVERHEQDAQLRRLLAAREKEATKAEQRSKRKASAADLDDNQRKSSRQRTKVGGGRAGEASSAIAAYKKQREEQKLRGEQRKSMPSGRRAASPTNDYSDADAEGESDNDYAYGRARQKSHTPPPKDDPTAELVDIQRVRIGRDNFAQVCWTPGFEDTIAGCYARVCLGPGRQPGVNEYRLCSIKGFQEGRPYALTGSSGKPFVTNRYIVAAHGKATRPWSFVECSNSKFTDDEWRRYRLTMANEDCRMPTKGQVNAKLKQINQLISHRFTDAEISDKLKKQTALIDLVNRADEKRDIKAKIYAAEERGDDDAVAELEEKLANLVPMKLGFGTSLTPQTVNKSRQDGDRLAELNRRNQQATAEAMQKAAAAQRAKYRKKTNQPGLLAPRTIDDDLFGSGSDISRAGTPVNGGLLKAGVSSRAATPSLLGTANGTPAANGNDTPRSSTPNPLKTGGEARPGLPVIKKSKRDDEVLQGLDLGIDIDI